jgi:hypothetical protein
MFFLFSALDALGIDRANERRPCAGSESSAALVNGPSTTTSSYVVIASAPTSIVRLAMLPFAPGGMTPRLRLQHKTQSCLGYPRPPFGNLIMPHEDTCS